MLVQFIMPSLLVLAVPWKIHQLRLGHRGHCNDPELFAPDRFVMVESKHSVSARHAPSPAHHGNTNTPASD